MKKLNTGIHSDVATSSISGRLKIAKKAGAIRAAHSMIGEEVHALTQSENGANLVEAFKQVLPKKRIICIKIDFQDPRLLKT